MFDSAHDNIIEQNDGPDNGLENISPSFNFDLWDGGVLNYSWGNNLGTANFLPVGDVPCTDVEFFRSHCLDDGTIQTRLVITTTDHDADAVTIAIDGSQKILPVIGRFAEVFSPGFNGPHTLRLDDPAMCKTDVPVDCP